MPLLNDMARCHGLKKLDENRATGVCFEWLCTKRAKCARYVERHTGSDRTPYFEYLCRINDESYIPAEKPNDT